jgi:hypothetical protein
MSNQTQNQAKHTSDELMAIGIDDQLGDDEILALLESEGLLQSESQAEQVKSELNDLKLLQSSLDLLKSPQSETEAFLLKQKVLFSLKKEKEFKHLKQSYFQTQILINVALVILFSCYCALFIQQKITQHRIGNLHQLEKPTHQLEKPTYPLEKAIDPNNIPKMP